MNEEQIAAKLAERADQIAPPPVTVVTEDDPESAPKTVQPESGTEPGEPVDPFVESQNQRALTDYLGLTPGTYNALNASHDIEKILSFVHQEIGSDRSAILSYIRGIEQAMGTTLFTSPQRLNRLSQFVTIRNQARMLKHAQEALVG